MIHRAGIARVNSRNFFAHLLFLGLQTVGVSDLGVCFCVDMKAEQLSLMVLRSHLVKSAGRNLSKNS